MACDQVQPADPKYTPEDKLGLAPHGDAGSAPVRVRKVSDVVIDWS